MGGTAHLAQDYDWTALCAICVYSYASSDAFPVLFSVVILKLTNESLYFMLLLLEFVFEHRFCYCNTIKCGLTLNQQNSFICFETVLFSLTRSDCPLIGRVDLLQTSAMSSVAASPIVTSEEQEEEAEANWITEISRLKSVMAAYFKYMNVWEGTQNHLCYFRLLL